MMMKRLSALALFALPIAAQAAEGQSGMPQLRFGDEALLGMVVWLVVIFGLLYYVASTYLLPPVSEVLADRASRIADDLTAARDTKVEADAAIRATRRAMAEARASAQAEVTAAVTTAGAAAHAKAEAAAAILAARTAEAEASIAQSRDRAMGALRDVATDTAVALVARLGVTASPATVGAAVESALTQRAA
ncbi:F0F1 ATP synthase subunit B' [Humitalea sp. 24SJ18S-53]|uniref:F0F1 ATP synthase subunit B family protein n=1 Tax=Humitalea sp. 24SJ18S-53 TaxID=3422307 RepID=UPI003D6726CC